VLKVLKWPTPPFSSVLKLLVKLFLHKSIRFGRYWRFGVCGLHGHLDPIAIFFLGLGDDLPPHFQVFWIQWCKKPTIMYHHLEDMGGFDFSVPVDFSCLSQNFKVWTLKCIRLLGFRVYVVMWGFAKFMELCQKYGGVS